MKISIFCLGANLLFTLMLVGKLRQGGLGIANTASAAFNLFLLFYALRRKLGRLDLDALRHMLLPIFGAGLAATITAAVANNRWEPAFGHQALAARLGAVFVPMVAASVVYWLVALRFKVPPAMELSNLAFQKIRWGRKLSPRSTQDKG